MSRTEEMARRVAASRRGAETRKRQAALRAFMADGTALPAPERGTGPRGPGERMGFDPSEIIARIKAKEAGG